MKRFFSWQLLSLAVVGVLLLSDFALACPGCKDAIASQKNGGDLVSGFQYSIMFMMAMPFTLLGCFCGYMYWEVKKAKAAQEARVALEASRQVKPQETLVGTR